MSSICIGLLSVYIVKNCFWVMLHMCLARLRKSIWAISLVVVLFQWILLKCLPLWIGQKLQVINTINSFSSWLITITVSHSNL